MEFLHENYGECSLVDECNVLQRNKCPVSKYVLSINNSNCCFNTSIIHSDEKDQIGFDPLRLPFDKMFELISALSFTTEYSNLLGFFRETSASECMTSMIFLFLCQSYERTFVHFIYAQNLQQLKSLCFMSKRTFLVAPMSIFKIKNYD